MNAKNFDDLAAPLYATAEGQRRMEELRREYEAEIFAYRIGELRRELGLDQAELAERLGMSQAGVSRLEKSTDPKLSTLIKLTSALGATLNVEVACQGHTVALAPHISLQERLKNIQLMPVPQNEESAKLKIVVPILQNLGWDPYGQEVLYEHSVGKTGGGRVDLALRASGRTVALIEVKAPKPNLDIYANQLLGYASDVEVDICVLTNGLEWLFYLPDEDMAPEKCKFAVLNIRDSQIEETLANLFAFLSREQLLSGQAKRCAVQVVENNRDLTVSGVEIDLQENDERLQRAQVAKNRPVGRSKTIVLFGERYTVKTNRDILMKIAEIIYVKNSEAFGKLLDLRDGHRPLVACDEDAWTLYRPNSKKSSIRKLEIQGEQTGYSVFVGNSSDVDIRRRARLFLEKLGHKSSDLTILKD